MYHRITAFMMVAVVLAASPAAAQKGVWEGVGVDQATSEPAPPFQLRDGGLAGTAGTDLPAVITQIDPNWISSLAPDEICGTYQRYLATLEGQGIGPMDGVCPEIGPCDDPINRNASIPIQGTPIKTYRLSIHVFCQNDGSNCAASLADVEGAVAGLNTRYAPWRIQFIYEVNFINSTKYRTLSSREAARMMRTYADSPATKLNIYVVDTGGVSWGTFPWDPNALTAQGGIVIDETWFRLNSPIPTILTHEVGHCLGLWHTFHGVDEVPQCTDCYEAAGRTPEQGDVTGDRCSDTNPTPTNANNCFDPSGTDPCSGNLWVSTPYLNYMGYSNFCPIEFTDQQAGRMHCWTSDILSGWLAGGGITVTPTAGLVTTEAGGTDSFTVVLDTAPTAVVTIDVSTSDDTEGLVSSGAQGPAVLVTLSFDSTNWDVTQEVTVTGVDDPDVDGDIPYTIITAPAVSTDANYSGLDPDDVSVTNLDDEPPDIIPPAAVTDLAVNAGATTFGSITLTWIATGDDGTTGTATRYDVRYLVNVPITEENWDTATQAQGEPFPQPSGSTETFTVTGLSGETTYFLALKVADEVPNWSDLSNVVFETTLEPPPPGPWVLQTVDAFGDVGRYTSIALDGAGNPHISYYDVTNLDAKYAKWTGSAWSIQTIPDSVDWTGAWCSLAVDGANVHVIYLDNTNNRLRYARLTGSDWSIKKVDRRDGGTWNSIVLDAGGNPHISYRSFTSGGRPGLKYARWTGSRWRTEEVDRSDGAAIRGTSLALDAGDPRIAYSDLDKGILQYAVWTGSAWQIETVDAEPGGQLGEYCSLALDASGNPHISYVDLNNGSLKYARLAGSLWEIEVVDGPGSVGSYTSLALDSFGNAHISYEDSTNSDLKYARWTGTAWVIEVVDDLGGVGSYSSLVLDGSGSPHISYFDATNGDLIYARKGGGDSLGMTCYADCDPSTGIGILDIFDFLCFQNSFVSGNPYACDCDTTTGQGVCDIFDFLCFQDAFVAGCP